MSASLADAAASTPRGVTSVHEASRDDLIRGIAENVQRIGLASERIGHLFADAQGLHTTDFRALTAIFRAERSGTPLTAKALAEHLQLSPAAITYVVERLVASGHVRRQQDEADRRRVILRFDEPGRVVAGAFFGPLAMAHLDALVSFDDQELAVASRVLGILVSTLDGFGQSLE
jgi:MarR family transcriptional regulator, organic hydroperoxide resistance regulator